MKRLIHGLLTAMAGAALFASPAIAQQSGETLTFEIDVFSGRPNPKFSLDAADLPMLYTKMASLCGRSDAPAVDYPAEFLGYRGVIISRAGASGRSGLSAFLSRKGARFLRSNTPAVCQSRALSASADIVVVDATSELEKHVIDVALQKGHIDASVHAKIMKAIDSGGP